MRMQSNNREKRITKVKKKIRPLLEMFGVKRASLFGSFVRDDFSKKSDVDILVEFPEEKSLLDLVHLERELKQELGRKVDLVTYASIHSLLKDSILSEEVPIFP